MDYELDAAKSLEVEQHLETCPDCAKSLEGFRRLSRAISDNAAYYRAPSSLENRIRSAMGAETPAEREPSQRRFTLRWATPALAAAVIILFAAIFALPRILTPSSNALLIEEVTASHVRSLMGTHLVDVISSDQHTVKPWFNGKLDYSPPVNDLKSEGFPLVGGRLDYLDSRPVAALVYRRHKHLINLYLWPSTAANSSVQTETRQGYHIDHWTQSGMNYWAVSDVSPVDLSQFIRLIQNPPAPAPELSH
jgi:anti-sigma factor RsiW